MYLTLDRHNGVPAYRQIIDQVRFQVASGVLDAGSELPSTRALSAELGINPMTVSKAYGLLERDGVVERRPGKPVVVRAQPQDEADAGREEELRRALAPAVSIARQLGLGRDEIQAVLDALLAAPETTEPEGESR